MSLLSLRQPLRPRGPALRDGDLLPLEGAAVRLRVDRRVSRVSLWMDVRSGEVLAIAPTARKLGDAAAFAARQAQWVRERLARAAPRTALAPGGRIAVGGEDVLLVSAPGRPALRRDPIAGARLTAPGEGEAFAAAAVRLLKREALRVLEARTAHYAALLDQPTPRVGLGDARTRWGSCRAAHGAEPALIRYSWRLILSPPHILDYVVAHECAHLLEMNHSDRFWAVCHDLHPDTPRARAWLKTNGAALQAVG